MNEHPAQTHVIKGYILDIDGTLLSSKKAHLNSWKRALREYGIFKTDEEIVSHFGKPTYIIAYELSSSTDSKLAEEIAKLKTDYLLKEIEKIPLYPGVTKVLEKIHDLGYDIVFASSNYNRIIEKMYKVNGWERISKGYIGIDDIEHGKPHPEMIYKAMDLLKKEAKECVMIGDSYYDVQAGKAAGTWTVAVCTKHTREEWENEKPDLVLDKFADLLNYLPLQFPLN